MKRLLLPLAVLLTLASCQEREQTCWQCTTTYNEPPKPVYETHETYCGMNEAEIRAWEKRWSFNNRVRVDGELMTYSIQMRCR